MDIQKTIDTLLVNSEEIMKAYPTVTNIRHELKDIPYKDLLEFGRLHKTSIHMDSEASRAYMIHSPIIKGKMDNDFWLYSAKIIIKAAEVIAY